MITSIMMDEVDNNSGLQSVNNDRRIGDRLSFSPIIPPPSQDKNEDAEHHPAEKKDGDNNDDGIETKYEDPPAAGVEENISVLPRSLLPPSTPEDPTKKNNRERASQGIRSNDAKADESDGGSRLVSTNSMLTSDGGNNRTCLRDAVMQILPPTTNRHLVQSAITSSMPKEGDTSVKDIKQALADSGLILVRVGGKYIRKGGAPLHLLKEIDCNIIVNIKLTNSKGGNISHFVAWDGNFIYDKPFSSKVNNSHDRTSRIMSKLAFGKLYPRPKFIEWLMTQVFELVERKN